MAITTTHRQESANGNSHKTNGESPNNASPDHGCSRLHRLGEVRRQEGVSHRTVARRLGISVADVKQQENENADLSLSRLLQWQQVLHVPLVELLVEPGNSLSPPLLKRTQLMRLMKTVLSILEKASQTSVRRLAETMAGQLTEIMPELRDVSPGPTTGGRGRRREEYGRAAEFTLSDELFIEGLE